MYIAWGGRDLSGLYADFVTWVRASGAADFAGAVDFPISIIGLIGTILAFFKAKTAAKASKEARDIVRRFESIVNFSDAINTLEEIKRLHRQNDAWPILPDRYATIRKTLIQLRSTDFKLNEAQLSTIQSALVNLRAIERQVEKGLSDPSALKPMKFNSIISDDIDGLIAVLTQLKSRQTGDAA